MQIGRLVKKFVAQITFRKIKLYIYIIWFLTIMNPDYCSVFWYQKPIFVTKVIQ